MCLWVNLCKMLNIALTKVLVQLTGYNYFIVLFRDYHHSIFLVYLFKLKSLVSSQCNYLQGFLFSFFYVFLSEVVTKIVQKNFCANALHFYYLYFPVYTQVPAGYNQVQLEQYFQRKVYNYSLKQFLDYNSLKTIILKVIWLLPK